MIPFVIKSTPLLAQRDNTIVDSSGGDNGIVVQVLSRRGYYIYSCIPTVPRQICLFYTRTVQNSSFTTHRFSSLINRRQQQSPNPYPKIDFKMSVTDGNSFNHSFGRTQIPSSVVPTSPRDEDISDDEGCVEPRSDVGPSRRAQCTSVHREHPLPQMRTYHPYARYPV